MNTGTCKCLMSIFRVERLLQVLFGQHPSAAHVCLYNHRYWGKCPRLICRCFEQLLTSCLNGSILFECLTSTVKARVRFPAGTCQSQDLEMTLVKSLHATNNQRERKMNMGMEAGRYFCLRWSGKGWWEQCLTGSEGRCHSQSPNAMKQHCICYTGGNQL